MENTLSVEVENVNKMLTQGSASSVIQSWQVRYQSRKKLAEQRPRVRAQFVRRVTDDNQSKSETKDTDS